MRPRDLPEVARLRRALATYEVDVAVLPGLSPPTQREVFLERIIESERRVRYVDHFVQAAISPSRVDPSSGRFDPIKAAILNQRAGDFEEACWMVFLFAHFGKHRTAGWLYSSRVYRGGQEQLPWTWSRITSDIDGFRDWLDSAQTEIREGTGPHGFGNHRKYESLSGWNENGTGAVIASYIDWVMTEGTHGALFGKALSDAAGDPTGAFERLYVSMNQVRRFGRVGRFDYLSMISKLDLARIRPGRAYLVASTGPLAGARLLFDGSAPVRSTAAQLEDRAVQLEEYLQIGFDPLEDALCNWQKSPDFFRPFRG